MPTEDNDGIAVESLEVGGVKVDYITDSKGHRWAVPADDDNVDIHEDRNIYEIPRREPDFRYQYVAGSRLNEFLTRGFVLVDRDEIEDPTKPSYSVNPLLNKDSTHHQVGNDFLVKIPEVLAKRMDKVKALRAKEAVAGIMVPRHLGKSLAEADVQVKERNQTVEMVRPKHEEPYPSAKE